MKIVVSRQNILKQVSGKARKYCVECQTFFEPAPLAKDVHASHFSWFLPRNPEDFENWAKRIREKDDSVWGYIMDEHGTRSDPYCPSDFTLEIKD